MKILVTSYNKVSSVYGGGEVYVRNLIVGLARNGHEVVALSLAFSGAPRPQRVWEQHAGVCEVQLTLPQGWQQESIAADSPAVAEIVSLMTDIAPEVVHSNGWKDVVNTASLRAGIPCVVTAHHGGIVCPAGALLNGRDKICSVVSSDDKCLACCVRQVPGWRLWSPLLKALSLGLRLKLGRVIKEQRFVPFVSPLGTMSLSIRNKIESVLSLGLNASRVIAPSPAILEALVRNGLPEDKGKVVPHGIPLPIRRPLKEGLGQRPVHFLFVGRINHVKGVHVMLEAFNGLLPETYKLHVVGDAATKLEKRYLRRLKKRFAGDNVTWHDQKAHAEIPSFIESCDLMVHPAICLEVFGLTIAESLAAGRPVIATRCGGSEIQIQDGVNGMLVPPNDPVALRKALQDVIDDPVSIEKMAAGAGVVRSLENHIEDLEKVYQGVCYEEKTSRY